jgi:competence protein ComEA
MSDVPDNANSRERSGEIVKRPDARAGAIDVTPATSTDRTPDENSATLAALRLAALRAAGVLKHPNLPTGEQPRFWLRRTDQLVVAVLVAASLVLMGIFALRMHRAGNAPIEIRRLPAGSYIYRIDINRATWVEWAQFEGIGETLARRIVEDRETNGPFRSIDDLLRVRGIGRTRFQGMRRHLYHSADDSANREERSDRDP